MTRLHQCDPSVVEGETLPTPFLQSIYVANELMERLGFDVADEEDVATF